MSVLFLPKQKKLVFCLDGVEGSRRFPVTVRTAGKRAMAELPDSLLAFHNECTITPNAVNYFWHDPTRRIPVAKAELEVQKLLVLFLRMHLGTDNIVKEHDGAYGRCDVWLLKGSFLDADDSCIIELKILKSRFPPDGTSTFSERDNVNHALEGVSQAVAYSKATKSNMAVLCCFDARDRNTDLPAVRSACVAAGVLFERHYMESTVRAARETLMQQIVTSALDTDAAPQ